jgi:hypothetical protein
MRDLSQGMTLLLSVLTREERMPKYNSEFTPLQARFNSHPVFSRQVFMPRDDVSGAIRAPIPPFLRSRATSACDVRGIYTRYDHTARRGPNRGCTQDRRSVCV